MCIYVYIDIFSLISSIASRSLSLSLSLSSLSPSLSLFCLFSSLAHCLTVSLSIFVCVSVDNCQAKLVLDALASNAVLRVMVDDDYILVASGSLGTLAMLVSCYSCWPSCCELL